MSRSLDPAGTSSLHHALSRVLVRTRLPRLRGGMYHVPAKRRLRLRIEADRACSDIAWAAFGLAPPPSGEMSGGARQRGG